MSEVRRDPVTSLGWMTRAGWTRQVGWTRRAVWTSVFATLAVLMVPAALWAHAHLERSEPAAGATLTVAPTQLKLWFSEAPDLSVSGVTLSDSSGAEIPLGTLQRGKDHKLLHVDIARPIGTGRFTIKWHVVAADGHPSKGSFTFAVMAPGVAQPAGATPPALAAAPADSADSAAVGAMDAMGDMAAMPGHQVQHGSDAGQVVARFVELTTILIMIGALAFVLLVLPRARDLPAEIRTAAHHRVATLMVVAGVILLASAVVRLMLEARVISQMTQTSVSATTVAMSTTWGRGWLLQLVATIVLVLAAARLRNVAVRVVAVLAALLLAATPGLSGHAAASAQMAGLAVVAAGVHVLAASGWLGSLLLVAAVGIPICLRGGGDARWGSVASLIRSFSPVALTFGILVVVTGIINAKLRVGGPHALVSTDYGQTLIVKLVLVAIALAIGAFNWRRVRPTLGTEGATARLRTSAAAELTAAVVIVIVTAVLMGLPTPQ